MATGIRPVPDDPEDEIETDVVATPEGDNEFLPEEPLEPLGNGAAVIPLDRDEAR
jgi:hypothetical protein